MNDYTDYSHQEPWRDVLARAEWRWPDILQSAGVDAAAFTGKHGPCPNCGGKDRFRWKKADEKWFCGGCSDEKYKRGIDLLMAVRGAQFFEAIDYLRSYFGERPVVETRRLSRPTARIDKTQEHGRNLARIRRIWTEAVELTGDDPVMRYLRNRVRGLNFIPEWVRFHRALDYWEPPEEEGGKPRLVGRFPAMVAKAFATDGRCVQLHKTYLTTDGRKADVPFPKKTEKGIGECAFAVPLRRVEGDTIGLGEGLESSAAAAMLLGIPVWSCLNGASLASFVVPARVREQGIKRLVIAADHDELKPTRAAGGAQLLRSAGLHYAEQCAQVNRAQGLRVLIVKSARRGNDMVDHLCQKASADQALMPNGTPMSVL